MKCPYLNRALLSVLVFCCFLVLVTSGLVLYAAPPGHRVDWHLLSLGKRNWRELHLYFGFAFIGIGVLHLAANWKPFISFVRARPTAGLSMRPEPIIALALSALLVAAAIT